MLLQICSHHSWFGRTFPHGMSFLSQFSTTPEAEFEVNCSWWSDFLLSLPKSTGQLWRTLPGKVEPMLPTDGLSHSPSLSMSAPAKSERGYLPIVWFVALQDLHVINDPSSPHTDFISLAFDLVCHVHTGPCAGYARPQRKGFYEVLTFWQAFYLTPQVDCHRLTLAISSSVH